MRFLIAFLNHRFVIWAVLASPMIVMTFGYARESLYYGEVLHASGEWSARLLMLTLAVTPLRTLFPRAGPPLWLMRRRRWLGVATFAYAAFHTVIYLVRKSDWSLVIREGLAFDMWTAWLSLGVLWLLALSSNDYSVRLLKRGWKRLHRWVYAAAILAFVHWIFIAFDIGPALIHLAILSCLEAWRVARVLRPARAKA
jgi:sulfoxide reductase heme-binding subunit YedZ